MSYAINTIILLIIPDEINIFETLPEKDFIMGKVVIRTLKKFQ